MNSNSCDRSEALLDRFAPQLRWVTDSVTETNSIGSERYIDRDDILQLGRLQLLRYANLVPGWGNNRLAQNEQLAEGDESQVKALMARQLRMDLNQTVRRKLERRVPAQSIDVIIERNESVQPDHDEFGYEVEYNPGESFNKPDVFFDPADNSWEERVAGQIDTSYLDRFAHDFPFLAAQQIAGMDRKEMTDQSGIPYRTITRRLDAEKLDLRVIYDHDGTVFGEVLKRFPRKDLHTIRQQGLYKWLAGKLSARLTVEGDEDRSDLIEAAIHMWYER